MEGGPARTHYGRTKSEGFDPFAFDDWFNTIFLPRAKKLLGTKVLIGDNLSNHLKELLLSECEKQHRILLFTSQFNTSTLILRCNFLWITEMMVRRKSRTITKEEFQKLLFKLNTKLYPKGNEVSANMQICLKTCGIYSHSIP